MMKLLLMSMVCSLQFLFLYIIHMYELIIAFDKNNNNNDDNQLT